jgi:hypothetical protein
MSRFGNGEITKGLKRYETLIHVFERRYSPLVKTTMAR